MLSNTFSQDIFFNFLTPKLTMVVPKVIQELLGHSKISITLEVYSHVLPSMQQEAAGKMDEVFKKS